MADIDDFDLDRSIAQAWAEFQSRLSEVISLIDDTADLTIGTESGGNGPPPFVRLSSPRPGVVRCEAASNAVLGGDFQLSAELLSAMERLGWQPPTVGGEPPSATQSAEPTANFWIELPQVESDRISELAVAALRDIYGVQHPVFLAPDQLAEALQPYRQPSRVTPRSRSWRWTRPISGRPCRVTSNISTILSMPSLPRYTAIFRSATLRVTWPSGSDRRCSSYAPPPMARRWCSSLPSYTTSPADHAPPRCSTT